MKVIQFYKSENHLIKKAANQNRDAQKRLYEKYAPKMLGVCRQYIKDVHHAEDVMLGAFLKVFTKLDKFKFEGSFEGWVRRIMVNESISFLRSQKDVYFTEEVLGYKEDSWNNIQTELEVAQIQDLIDQLPKGYRMIFNLYVIEGYKHNEIAERLQISESTSKSQLFKARKILQKKLTELNTVHHGTAEI